VRAGRPPFLGAAKDCALDLPPRAAEPGQIHYNNYRRHEPNSRATSAGITIASPGGGYATAGFVQPGGRGDGFLLDLTPLRRWDSG
jgi:hypothetical protein